MTLNNSCKRFFIKLQSHLLLLWWIRVKAFTKASFIRICVSLIRLLFKFLPTLFDSELCFTNLYHIWVWIFLMFIDKIKIFWRLIREICLLQSYNSSFFFEFLLELFPSDFCKSWSSRKLSFVSFLWRVWYWRIMSLQRSQKLVLWYRSQILPLCELSKYEVFIISVFVVVHEQLLAKQVLVIHIRVHDRLGYLWPRTGSLIFFFKAHQRIPKHGDSAWDVRHILFKVFMGALNKLA